MEFKTVHIVTMGLISNNVRKKNIISIKNTPFFFFVFIVKSKKLYMCYEVLNMESEQCNLYDRIVLNFFIFEND